MTIDVILTRGIAKRKDSMLLDGILRRTQNDGMV